jgi:hypothetical protein
LECEQYNEWAHIKKLGIKVRFVKKMAYGTINTILFFTFWFVELF